MKKQIVSISVLQSSKIVTAIYFLIGFVYTFVGTLLILFGAKRVHILGVIYLFGPIFMSIIGFIVFVISASIYNVLAKWLGGIEVEVKDVEVRTVA